jgi:hypothetical protein
MRCLSCYAEDSHCVYNRSRKMRICLSFLAKGSYQRRGGLLSMLTIGCSKCIRKMLIAKGTSIVCNDHSMKPRPQAASIRRHIAVKLSVRMMWANPKLSTLMPPVPVWLISDLVRCFMMLQLRWPRRRNLRLHSLWSAVAAFQEFVTNVISQRSPTPHRAHHYTSAKQERGAQIHAFRTLPIVITERPSDQSEAILTVATLPNKGRNIKRSSKQEAKVG